LKSWLFTVAYHEAMLVRRREGAARRAIVQKAFWQQSRESECPAPDRNLVRSEMVERVRRALAGLSAEQADVVRRRMFKDQKFADIAAELRVPLGTVLTRMRSALAKLRSDLGKE
jgi:RNA polymerase sigma factor (sigma-70 family)